MELNGDRRARRKDRTAQENGDVRSLASAEELDPWTAWAYKPRTISLLLVGACFLIWASGALDPENSSSGDIITSVKRGIWAMIAVFLAYCLLQAPSTILIRPHPAIWRLVHGMAVIYLVALTFLLFQWLVIIGGGGGEDQGWLRDGGVAVKDLEHLRVGVVMEVLFIGAQATFGTGGGLSLPLKELISALLSSGVASLISSRATYHVCRGMAVRSLSPLSKPGQGGAVLADKQ
ncbi:hypothetical protein CsSME_00037417 [Camellia sinensis var. sinensis]